MSMPLEQSHQFDMLTLFNSAASDSEMTGGLGILHDRNYDKAEHSDSRPKAPNWRVRLFGHRYDWRVQPAAMDAGARSWQMKYVNGGRAPSHHIKSVY
jgi:hypothetical protein